MTSEHVAERQLAMIARRERIEDRAQRGRTRREAVELRRLDGKEAITLKSLRQSEIRQRRMLEREKRLSVYSPQSSWQAVMDAWKYCHPVTRRWRLSSVMWTYKSDKTNESKLLR